MKIRRNEGTAEDRTVLIMHLLNLPAEPIPFHHIVIKLIPSRRGCELRPREFGQWGEVEAIDEAIEGVDGREEGGGGEEGRVHLGARSGAAQRTEVGTTQSIVSLTTIYLCVT